MKDTIKKLRSSLIPMYGDRETEAIIRIIFHYLKGWNLTDMLMNVDKPLSPFIKGEIDKIAERLSRHEPIQYITGEARFHGMNLKVRPGVLIPRQETDELTDIIISDWHDKDDLDVLDLCTGSGCIALALYHNLKFPKIDALDISKTALETAGENAKDLNCNINFIDCDIFKWTPCRLYDIIVSNPPYVDEDEAASMEKNVLDYEPHEAIFVKNDNPLVFYSRITDIAAKSLKDTGTLYLEINPAHVNELIKMTKEKGFREVTVLLDSYGKKRFLVCKKN